MFDLIISMMFCLFLQLYYNILPKVIRNNQEYVALRLQPLLEITGNLSMESKIRDVLKQLYKKSYRGLQYFLDPQSTLSYTYPVRTKRKTIRSHASVFLSHTKISKLILWRSYTQVINFL